MNSAPFMPPPRRWLTVREVWRVYRARLRDHWYIIQQLLVVLGIAIGVALLFSARVASTSLGGAVQQLNSQIVGATRYQIIARGPEGFSESVASEIRRVPGVSKALPVLEQSATLVGHSGSQAVDLLGVSPQFLEAGGPVLRRFSASELKYQRGLALPAPLAATVGVEAFQKVRMRIGGYTREPVVLSVLTSKQIGALTQSPIVVTPIAYAQQMTNMSGEVTRVFIQTRSGNQQRVHAALAALARTHELNLEPANSEATQFAVAAAPQSQGEGLLSAISALLGFVFAFNAILLSIPGRRRFVWQLRRLAYSREETVQLLAIEALVLGIAAAALGFALGELLSIGFFATKPGYLTFAFPVGSPRIVSLPTVVLAVSAGIITAAAGVFWPTRHLLRRSLADQSGLLAGLRRITGNAISALVSVIARYRIAIGVFALVITTAIVLLRPQSAVLGNATLILALVCLLPSFLNFAIDRFDGLQSVTRRASPRLALVELRDPVLKVRSLAVALTAGVAVFGAVAILGAQRNLQAGLNRTAIEMNDVTGLWVSPAGQANALGTTPFDSTAIAAKLGRLHTVRSVSIYRGGFLTMGRRRIWVIAPPATSTALAPQGQLVSGDPQRAAARVRAGGWAVVSEAIASEHHLRIGSSFVLPSPHPVTLRVAALSTNMGWPPGAIIVSANEYIHGWGSSEREASALNVTLAPGASPAHVRQEALAVLGDGGSGFTVQTAREREQNWKAISKQGLGRLSQIATLVLVAAILAISGIMCSIIWQRQPNLASLKRVAYSRGCLWRALFWECAVLVFSGCFLGAIFGLYGQLVISHALATVTGFPVVIGVGTLLAVTNCAIVCGFALIILMAFGGLVVRLRTTVRPLGA